MIRAVRVLFLAGAIALGVAGLYLSALILAIGSVLLHLFDLEVKTRMTETTVSYHVEDGVGRPAIDVKDHHGYYPYSIALQRLVGPVMAEQMTDDGEVSSSSVAYDRITSDFWQAASEIAEQRGLGEIEQQGRSGGWLVFTECDPNDPTHWKEAGEITEWLAGYRAMVEWADTWIADAPRKVAALAQQYAMDEAGEDAARRMFARGFDPIPAANWSYNGGAPREAGA